MFTFVKRFERENLPITEFEADKPYNARIENIIKIIRSYVDTSKQIEEPQD
jgi:hypothetical protein